ncbi:MAG: peptidoglycan DD-metalloendopeptidase family protein, partial [Siculibacillus sp.]|nr:peptidoglycan DD-metalloendopeptidase family protein [Siculibacillus sp.]
AEGEPRLASLGGAGRLQPAMAFAETRGTLPLPVAGETIRRWGEDDGLGGSARGLTIATREEARVTSPCDGWVVFFGPFRSYGKLLIINGGGGYHVVLAGIDRIDVELGQFVLAGEPVGVMGTRRAAAVEAAAARGSEAGRPLLYVEFRKDNAAIDSTPWWARTPDEKVRG